MKTELKTVLGLLAFMGLAALVYSVIQKEAEAEEVSEEKEEPLVKGNGENKYDSFLEEKRQRFKNSLEYTPFKEVLIEEQIEQHGNCDVLDKISKNEIGIAQITVVNSSSDYREINLWGASNAAVSAPMISEVSAQQLLAGNAILTGIHPQNVGVNPFTQLVYVVNQLSDSVSVYDASGTPITTVFLGASIPGGISPVALDFNPLNGESWVVGSVSNNVYIIDIYFNITMVISSGGRRPLDIKYHALNHSFYVANMVSGVLSEIDATSYILIGSVNPGSGRPSLEIVQESGKICILIAQSSVLLVYNLNNAFLGVVAPLSSNSFKVIKGGESGKIFVLSSFDVTKIDIDIFLIIASSLLPSLCSGLGYNAYNGYLYMLSKVSGQIHYYDQNLIFLSSMGALKCNLGIAFNTENGRFYFTGTAVSQLYIGAYASESSFITINDDYTELKNALSQIPGLILDMKISFSTADKFSNLFIRKHTVTGLSNGDAFSMNAYYAPQTYSNIAIVYGMRGEIIDSKTEWRFIIAPLQSITFLIKILQKVPRPSAGVMSPDRQLRYTEKILHRSRAA